MAADAVPSTGALGEGGEWPQVLEWEVEPGQTPKTKYVFHIKAYYKRVPAAAF